MKNAAVAGIIIGVLSGFWLFAMHWAGYNLKDGTVPGIFYVSILIPILGLFFGVRAYRDNVLGGVIGFIQALGHGFKILIVGGIIAIAFSIWYISYIEQAGNVQAFSGWIFGALLIGVLSAIAVALVTMTKPEQVD